MLKPWFQPKPWFCVLKKTEPTVKFPNRHITSNYWCSCTLCARKCAYMYVKIYEYSLTTK